MILKLTWRNLWRNPRRSLITISSIAFAVMLAIVMGALQKGVFDNLVRNVVSFYSGYLQVHRAGYWEERVIEESFAEDSARLSSLAQVPGVRAIVPRLESFALASSGNTTKGCMVTGTEALPENLMTGLQGKISQGGYLDGTGRGVLLAEGLARKLGIGVQDTLVLLGQGYQGRFAAGKYPVRGVARFGAPELNNTMVFMDLPVAQAYLGAESQLTSLAFAIDAPENLPRIKEALLQRIGPGYEVMTWEEMMPEIERHIRADNIGFYIQAGILYLIIAFGMYSTLLMMLAERRHEFGMLVAIGMKKARLTGMLLAENIMLSVLGTTAGMVLALPLVLYLKHRPIRFGGQVAKAYEQFGFEAVFPAALDGGIFITQALIVLSLALVIGIYPVWHVARINPVASMKH
jgi:ABC-type lipoprotein release transport system permease subunit